MGGLQRLGARGARLRWKGQGGTMLPGGVAGSLAVGGNGGERGCVAVSWVYDGDDDGYGDALVPSVQTCTAPVACPSQRSGCDLTGWKKQLPRTDCNDAKSEINPGVWDGPAYMPLRMGVTPPGIEAHYYALRNNTQIHRIDRRISERGLVWVLPGAVCVSSAFHLARGAARPARANHDRPGRFSLLHCA